MVIPPHPCNLPWGDISPTCPQNILMVHDASRICTQEETTTPPAHLPPEHADGARCQQDLLVADEEPGGHEYGGQVGVQQVVVRRVLEQEDQGENVSGGGGGESCML